MWGLVCVSDVIVFVVTYKKDARVPETTTKVVRERHRINDGMGGTVHTGEEHTRRRAGYTQAYETMMEKK